MTGTVLGGACVIAAAAAAAAAIIAHTTATSSHAVRCEHRLTTLFIAVKILFDYNRHLHFPPFNIFKKSGTNIKTACQLRNAIYIKFFDNLYFWLC